MSTPQEIADRSMQLAGNFLDSARKEIEEMAGGDFQMLREAADLVRANATKGAAISHSAEHLAFSVITAANRSLIE
jgi:hypothetical protein